MYNSFVAKLYFPNACAKKNFKVSQPHPLLLPHRPNTHLPLYTDIDECVLNARLTVLEYNSTLCITPHVCINIIGSYECACPPGTVKPNCSGKVWTLKLPIFIDHASLCFLIGLQSCKAHLLPSPLQDLQVPASWLTPSTWPYVAFLSTQ